MRTSVDRVSRRPVPVFLGIVLTLGVAAAMVACDPVPDPPNWSAKISSQGVSLAFCESLVADELGADIEQSSGSRWREVWRVDGTIRAETGDLLLMGDKKPGMTSDEYLRDVIGPRSIILVFAIAMGNKSSERCSTSLKPAMIVLGFILKVNHPNSLAVERSPA